MLLVLEQLVRIHRNGGPLMHLDIEPEPDGMMENTSEFISWYFESLLPAGIPFLKEKFNVDDQAAADLIKSHICLCYDVCHFALVYEAPHRVLDRIRHYGLKIGKLQISAALKADMPADQDARHKVTAAFRQFNEPVYLHQVIARRNDGTFLHYPDLPEALADEKIRMLQNGAHTFMYPFSSTGSMCCNPRRKTSGRCLPYSSNSRLQHIWKWKRIPGMYYLLH